MILAKTPTTVDRARRAKKLRGASPRTLQMPNGEERGASRMGSTGAASVDPCEEKRGGRASESPEVSASRALSIVDPGELAERARAYASTTRARSTDKSYAHDWLQFERWCASRELDPHNADDAGVALYLAWMADRGRAPSSVERAWHGIYTHLGAVKGDLCRKVLRGIRRDSPHRTVQKRPLVAAELALCLAHLGAGPLGIRNRAMLLTGFAGGFRRSELAALRRADLEFSSEGVRVSVRRSKTDQDGKGQQKGLARARGPVCAVAALESWLAYLDTQALCAGEQAVFPAMGRTGRIFARAITPQCVLLVLRGALERAGFELAPYGAHSLRAGFVTQATLNRKPLDAIMRQTGHRSIEQLLGYIRHAQVFTENASDGLFDS